MVEVLLNLSLNPFFRTPLADFAKKTTCFNVQVIFFVRLRKIGANVPYRLTYIKDKSTPPPFLCKQAQCRYCTVQHSTDWGRK
jgi:hypothetical protein